LESLVFEEIRILQAMSHPHVLKFHEALLSDRNCYIVTELCLGGNLDERIKRGPPMSNTEIAGILMQLIEGMKYLRKMQVVHRDLKPANIFFGERIKIADFGLARFYTYISCDLGKDLRIWILALLNICRLRDYY
jgi:serine/threonine protein kinase